MYWQRQVWLFSLRLDQRYVMLQRNVMLKSSICSARHQINGLNQAGVVNQQARSHRGGDGDFTHVDTLGG